jgi:uncharacterized membrane protein YheB (UPF0754 family)
VLGIVPLALWTLTHDPVIIAVFGVLIGAVTNWLALKMIFLPREPRRFGKVLTWQGVFQKRRAQVAVDYGTLIATEMLTVDNIVEAVLIGPRSDRLFEIIQREVRRTIDEQAGLAKPFVVAGVGARQFRELKVAVAHKAIERVPAISRHAEEYVVGALDVRNTIVERMNRLDRLQFEQLVRPAFRQDEWKLIAVGGLIGGVVGALQATLMLGS